MIRPELIDAIFTKKGHTIKIEQTKECEAICKALNLDVFELEKSKDVYKPTKGSKQ